ncbi:MAG: NAD(P)/FAD-dependent oxidoreductase [Betaproteobacteria bacterium]|nr:NAD(P)/FAD-dependent oxidoreductase [Betaproteobacteria bacterium]
MVAVLDDLRNHARDEVPVVVIGAGPVGVRVAQELRRRAPALPVVIYGAEPWAPYNRVRLSSALAGEMQWAEVTRDVALPPDAATMTRFGCSVTAIQREIRCVVDRTGRVQPYSRLVLATGSTPHVPDIPGIAMSGVFTFRDWNDAQQLAARLVRSRATVVLGGGLLGLEAARAMRRFHTRVTVVEHCDRLMARQLDHGGAELLRLQVEESGIAVVLEDGVTRVLGAGRVEGVRLRGGREIACDTLVVATGIRPNLQLALQAGLSIGRGIRVNDRMQTTDNLIYAAGECAEHRGAVYGVVAPGLEQAAVAAHNIAGGDAQYTGSAVATRLKVMRFPVFSVGEFAGDELPELAREQVFHRPAEALYRKIVIRRGRIIGAIAVGEWDELARVQEAVARGRKLHPWNRWRFARSGGLWPAAAGTGVAHWPQHTAVCNCTGITRGCLTEAIDAGCGTVEQLAAATGASTVCGSCRPLLAQLCGSAAAREPVPHFRALFVLAIAALGLGLAAGLLPSIPYASTVQLPLRWDVLWRESLWKQVSGFSLLALAVALAVLGLRKRWRRFSLGEYAGWRLVHVAIGTGALALLFVHTGGRLGDHLNLALSGSMVGLALVGAVAGGVISREHALEGPGAKKLKDTSLRLHVLFLWPLPVLLAFHVLKTYWY